MRSNRCNYVFTIRNWLRNTNRDRIPEIQLVNIFHAERPDRFHTPGFVAWACPHDSYEDTDYCIFHHPLEAREEYNIQQEEVKSRFLDCVESPDAPHEFIGAKFRNLNLRYENVLPSDNYPIRLDYAEFHGSVNLSHAEVGNIFFSGATFQKGLICHQSEFIGRAIFTYCDFQGRLHVYADFNKYLNFDGSTFHSNIRLSGEFLESVSMRQTRLEGNANFSSGQFYDRFGLRNVDLIGEIDCSYADIKELVLEPISTQDNENINFNSANIQSGVLYQPKNGSALYWLINATLGDVKIDSRETLKRNPFDYLMLYQTDFEKFDFTHYRQQLEDSKWEIHKVINTTEEGNQGIHPGQEFDGHPKFQTGVWETTYLKARHGANQIGDKRAASEFFIKEMKSRQYKHLTSMRDSAGLARVKSLADLTTNVFLEKTSIYGERPRRVILVSLIIIWFFGLAYPFVGGVRKLSPSDTVYSLKFGLPIELNYSEFVQAVGNSMYLSVTTFTTLGYGDIHPAGPLSSALAAFESLLGAALIALLVFVLGRTIKW